MAETGLVLKGAPKTAAPQEQPGTQAVASTRAAAADPRAAIAAKGLCLQAHDSSRSELWQDSCDRELATSLQIKKFS